MACSQESLNMGGVGLGPRGVFFRELGGGGWMSATGLVNVLNFFFVRNNEITKSKHIKMTGLGNLLVTPSFQTIS